MSQTSNPKYETVNPKIANKDQFEVLQNLSTENLIIWIIGKSSEKAIKLSIEDIALECWLVNPVKHSLRGYPHYPDSFVVMKRIFDMKGRKGLIEGTTAGGFKLTQLSKLKFNEIEKQFNSKIHIKLGSKNAVDRTISSMDEAPFRRLIRTPAYQKFKEGKTEQIVETDFLYFYGINWQNSKASVQGKLKNVDLIISIFEDKDPLLKKVREFLNSKFHDTKKSLIK
jgi:hypothetical protein